MNRDALATGLKSAHAESFQTKWGWEEGEGGGGVGVWGGGCDGGDKPRSPRIVLEGETWCQLRSQEMIIKSCQRKDCTS